MARRAKYEISGGHRSQIVKGSVARGVHGGWDSARHPRDRRGRFSTSHWAWRLSSNIGSSRGEPTPKPPTRPGQQKTMPIGAFADAEVEHGDFEVYDPRMDAWWGVESSDSLAKADDGAVGLITPEGMDGFTWPGDTPALIRRSRFSEVKEGASPQKVVDAAPGSLEIWDENMGMWVANDNVTVDPHPEGDTIWVSSDGMPGGGSAFAQYAPVDIRPRVRPQR